MDQQPDLSFDEATHTYRRVRDGAVVSSVTQILDDVLGNPFHFVDPVVLKRAQAFGTAVHHTTALFDTHRLDGYAIHAEVAPLLEQWMRFCREAGAVWTIIEQRRYNRLMNFAGTADRFGALTKLPKFDPHGFCNVDIKSGADSPHVGLQTAGYVELWHFDPRRTARAALYLEPDRYHLEPCTRSEDFADWTACWRVHRIKRKLQ